MQHATRVALTRRVIDFVERGTTELAESVYLNPVSTYACPRQAEREQHVLFRGHPLFFGLTCELPNPGDYRADDLSGVPILVVRGQDGARCGAFLNVCRHRGAKIASGSGSGKRLFVCPYHAWTYDLDGRLTRLNPEAGFPGLTCAERSLVPIPVAEKHGLIFVQTTQGSPIDVDALLGQDLDAEFASYGFDKYSHYQTQTLAKDMNWKLVVDTFLETWHVATLHKETVGPIFQPNVNAFDAFGRNGRLIIPRRSLVGEEERAREQLGSALSTAPSSTRCFPTRYWCGRAIMSRPGARSGRRRHGQVHRRGGTVHTQARRYRQGQALLGPQHGSADAHGRCGGLPRLPRHPAWICGGRAQTHITFGRNEPALGHYHRNIQQALGQA